MAHETTYLTILKYHSWYLCQVSLQIMLLPILIYNFTCEITKLPWQPSVRLSAKMAAKFFKNVMNEDVRALKDALENPNTQMSTTRRILSGILSKNSENYELRPKFKL